MSLTIGVDEVGRGPLAGPVVTCAILWPEDHGIVALDDSKKLSAKKRETLVPLIRDKAVKISFGRAEVDEIDRLNILHATMLAMERAVEGLGAVDAPIRIDGNRVPDGLKGRALAVVGGDGLIAAISAASILAKLHGVGKLWALAKCIPAIDFKVLRDFRPKRTFKPLKPWA